MLWIVRRVFRALRAPLRRPLEPLLWVAATLSAKDVWVRSNGRATLKRNRPAASPPVSTSSRSPPTLRYPPPLRSSQALPSISGRADGPGRRLRARGGAPLLIIAAQAQLDGTRWQVIPAYCAAVTCTAMGYAGRVGLRLPAIAYRTIAAAGAAGAALSTAAGLFAPVFPMPKPTGPYRVGKTTRMWIDRARRSWLLKTRRKTGKQPLPEHRMMMANVWYPAADANPKNKRHADESASKSASKSSTRDPQPWPEDEEAKAMFAAYFARRREDVSPETAKHQERYDARLRAARRRGERRRAHWMEPLLATTLAESFELPGWVVDYFRLVKMEATTDAPVANPPPVERHDDGEGHAGGFPLVLFSHSFTGVKEQNSALLQELASWGHVVVAVDHPHDAALVLYPDGSTADFRGYDMPRELEPRNWWRFRHEHARWRALDLAHALERMVDANSDPDHPLFRKIDLSRVSVIGHSFGGAAAVMLAQMDPRITSAVLFDPWMWPLGRERAAAGTPCPLLVFEAPEFMWDRDIFCVTNGEMSSLLCAATAPRAAGEGEGAGENERVAPGALANVGGEAETTASGDGTGEEAVRSHGEGGGRVDDGEGSGEGECAEGGGSGDTSASSAASSAASSFAAAVSSENASVSAEHEDPSKPAPGFVGSHVDGFAGVGYYDEDGYYFGGAAPGFGATPVSPTRHRRAAMNRPQHPRGASADTLASAASLGSVGSQDQDADATNAPVGAEDSGGLVGSGGSGGSGGSDRRRPCENHFFYEKRSFRSFLTISGPSRHQKWIRLEISGRMVVSGGLETRN